MAPSNHPIVAALEPYASDPLLKDILTGRFIQRMATFGASLALWGRKTNLTARPQDPAQLAFHVIDSLMPWALAKDHHIPGLGRVFAPDGRILDFGSGAGFPALVLASACGAHFVLAEARRRRASFLTVAAAEMGLDNVEVRRARVSGSSVSACFDAVFSRASGPSFEFYQVAARAAVPGGFAVLYATPSQRLALAAARAAGLGAPARYRYQVWRPEGVAERLLAVWEIAEKRS